MSWMIFAGAVIAGSLLFTWSIIRVMLGQQRDLLDRLQECIGTIHEYQVGANYAKLPAPGSSVDESGRSLTEPPGVGSERLWVPEHEEDAIEAARRSDGSIDETKLAQLLADAHYADQEVEVGS